MDIQQYQFTYPYLASFASDPSSPTYTRRSKTGKTVLVKKGKRKGFNKLAAGLGAVGGGLAISQLTRKVAIAGLHKGIDSGAINPEKASHLNAVQMGGNAAIITAGVLGGYGAYKLLRGDRGKE